MDKKAYQTICFHNVPFFLMDFHSFLFVSLFVFLFFCCLCSFDKFEWRPDRAGLSLTVLHLAKGVVTNLAEVSLSDLPNCMS